MTEDEKGRPVRGGLNILTTDSTAALGYLRSVYGESFRGWVMISAYGDGNQKAFRGFTSLEEAAQFAAMLDESGIYKGVYCTGATVHQGVPGRGTTADTDTLFYMSLDLDVWHPVAHKKPNLPRSLADCQDLVEALGFPEPTRWIDSGYGFYPQWQYPEPILVEDWAALQADYNEVKSYVEKVASRFGWGSDATFDLARVWKLPGTTNRKVAGEPRVARVIEQSGQMAGLEDLLKVVRHVDEPEVPTPMGGSQLFGSPSEYGEPKSYQPKDRPYTEKDAEGYLELHALKPLRESENGNQNNQINASALTVAHFRDYWSEEVRYQVLIDALPAEYKPYEESARATIRSAFDAFERFRAAGDMDKGWLAFKPEGPAEETKPLFVTGTDFLDSIGEDEEPIWGDADTCMWARGESVMLVGPPGVGKSTLAHLVVWARLGLSDGVFGMPVETDERKVLYLAMDRPRQIGRAMRRIVLPEHREVMRERLLVHKGPLPINVAKETEWILRQAEENGVGTVVVDSLKDLLPDLSNEETASLYNRARQLCLTNGIEWVELHHNRKSGAEGKPPKTLDDVYGSRWLTAGAGSVVSLFGQSGDSVVELSQIKTPSGELFPKSVAIDKDAGTMSFFEEVTIQSVLAKAIWTGIAAKDAAVELFGGKASKSQIESTRQKLDRMVNRGEAMRLDVDGVTYKAASKA